MKRTQLYLEDGIYKILTLLSKTQRKTLSELVREALRKVYGAIPEGEAQQKLKKSFGIWSDRADLAPTSDYLRQLRKSSRSKRFSFNG